MFEWQNWKCYPISEPSLVQAHTSWSSPHFASPLPSAIHRPLGASLPVAPLGGICPRWLAAAADDLTSPCIPKSCRPEIPLGQGFYDINPSHLWKPISMDGYFNVFQPIEISCRWGYQDPKRGGILLVRYPKKYETYSPHGACANGLKSRRNHSTTPKAIGSMYGIYANIRGILMVNVTIYSIHGSDGKGTIKKPLTTLLTQPWFLRVSPLSLFVLFFWDFFTHPMSHSQGSI